MSDETEGDSLAESIREETGGETETEEETGAEGEESEEGSESEGESEEGSEESGEEEEGEEAEASGPGDEEESEEGEEDEGERTRSRGQNRVQRLAEERNRLRAENEDLRRRVQGGNNGGGGGGGAAAPQPKTGQQIREEIIAKAEKSLDGLEFKTPKERANAVVGIVEEILGQVVQPLRFSAAEQQDRSNFRDKFGGNPMYKRLNAKVEERAAEARRQGLFIPRETLFKDLIGDETLRQIGKGGGSQRRQAEARRAKAKGTPTKGRGDAGKGSGKSRLQDLESRLEGKPI